MKRPTRYILWMIYGLIAGGLAAYIMDVVTR
jgi:uncharacterized membrane protein YeaQ/YmgE (transglycosylase-associated protein family)